MTPRLASGRGGNPRGKVQAIAFGLTVLVFALTWVRPLWPVEQAMHGSLAVVGLVLLAWQARRQPLGDGAFVAICAFIAIHCVAARWLYSNVPYDAWLRGAIGEVGRAVREHRDARRARRRDRAAGRLVRPHAHDLDRQRAVVAARDQRAQVAADAGGQHRDAQGHASGSAALACRASITSPLATAPSVASSMSMCASQGSPCWPLYASAASGDIASATPHSTHS